MIRLSALLVVLTFGLCCASLQSVVAQSQPPPPSRGVGERSQPPSNPGRTQAQAANDPRGTSQAPLVVQVHPTPKTDEEAANEQSQEDREAATYRWTVAAVISTGVLGLLQLIAIGFQVRIASKQNRIIKRQSAIMRGQRKAADTQSGYMRDGLTESKNAANIAKESADAAKESAKAALLSTRISQRAERAYVKLSHQPPGLTIEMFNRVSLSVLVKNIGRTPATVTDVRLKCFVVPVDGRLPDQPNYETQFIQAPVRVFLVAGDEFSYKGTFPLEDTPAAFNIGGKDATHRVVVIGYVDYMDVFENRYRAGYARHHDPSIDDEARYRIRDRKAQSVVDRTIGRFDAVTFSKRNNLPFVTQPSYNYDRQRGKTEGNDWDGE